HVSRTGRLSDVPAIFDELEAGAYLGRAVLTDLSREVTSIQILADVPGAVENSKYMFVLPDPVIRQELACWCAALDPERASGVEAAEAIEELAAIEKLAAGARGRLGGGGRLT